MGLAKFVYPRYAVPITSGGQAISIEKLRAHPLWYPGAGSEGLMVSGHVLYTARPLEDALMVALDIEDGEVEVQVEGGERGISHRLAAPVPTSRYASVADLICAVIDRVRQAVPETKGSLRRQLKELAAVGAEATPELLARVEMLLQQASLHVLVPLAVGERYQLFTDATEALLPVSPYVLGRQSRLCFVLLSTDSLVEKRAGSPWLRQAAEWMVLPVAPMRAHPRVASFVGGLTALRPALQDDYLMWDLAAAIHDLTGGWPDLCDRFYERLGRQKGLPELREWLRELARLARASERDPAGHADRLLEIGLGGAQGLPDLPPASGETGSVAHEVLLGVAGTPPAFRWEDHGRAYLDGLLGWDRGLAVPRCRAIDLALRGRLATRGARIGSGVWSVSELQRAVAGPKVRWLHVSDFHFKAKGDSDSKFVLDALLATVDEMRQHGRVVDLVFVTGDVAFSGRPEEYARAEAYLADLCAAAGVPRSAMHIVPGNHDVDRALGENLVRTLADSRAASRFFEESARRPHLEKLGAFRDFYNRFYAAEGGEPGVGPRTAAPGHATAGAEVLDVGGVSVGVLPLNTAWFAQDESDVGKLLVGEAVVEAGLQVVREATLRVALMHHPISDLSDLERRLVQERLLGGCNFVLRGHLHDTEAHSVNAGYQQTLVLAAGASYQGRIPSLYQNRAMFVEVEILAGNLQASVRPYPIRYELSGHDRWTLDTSVFPRSYPTYLETLSLPLTRRP